VNRRRGASVALLGAALGVSGFTAPVQPWVSADGQVRLGRPAVARIGTADRPLVALMAPGWRLIWDGSRPTPGELVVRLTLPVVPADGQGTATEVLQVGRSRVPADLRSCLTAGLSGARRLPPRTIGGVRFAAWRNGDAGMSQQIAATDLRAAVNGACYAVERFSYAERARDADPAVTLAQARGAAMLDAALVSLRLGGATPPAAPSLPRPPHAVAR
jgi:hypothetical protein